MVEVTLIAIVLLTCPNHHPVNAHLSEFASENPPQAWLETICRDHETLVGDASPERNRCKQCDAQYSPDDHKWLVSVHTGHKDPAKRALSTPEGRRIAEPLLNRLLSYEELEAPLSDLRKIEAHLRDLIREK